MNARLLTVLVAPLTKGGFTAPFRARYQFLQESKGNSPWTICEGYWRLGALDASVSKEVLVQLREIFAE
jgi:hypothetical protein